LNGLDGIGMTDASVGQPCSINTGMGTIWGTYQWYRLTPNDFIMTCHTNS
jgi:hypothetical protein